MVTERTALVNQMRGLLREHGIAVPLGRDLLERRLRAVFAEADARVSPRLVALLHRLRQRWLAIDVEIADVTRELTAWAAQSAACRRLETVPGVGLLLATATVAAVGNGRMCQKGGTCSTRSRKRRARRPRTIVSSAGSDSGLWGS